MQKHTVKNCPKIKNVLFFLGAWGLMAMGKPAPLFPLAALVDMMGIFGAMEPFGAV